MKSIISLCLFLLLPSILFCQNENSKWYFGDHAGLDFMTSPPTVLSNSANYSLYGCSSVADAAGNLLFYTDGSTVYDQTHNVMANGTGIGTTTNTNSLIYQYSLIVKKPGSANIYYIFTNCCGSSLPGLYYSTVDMSLAAGMGSVTIKNTVVTTVTPTGQLAISQHCNGKDVWVICHEYGNQNYKAYLTTNAGVNVTPVVSSVGFSGAISSYIKVSPSGKHLAAVYNSAYPTLFNFDNSTGVVSNSLALMPGNNSSGFEAFEFSPDGTKLYCILSAYMNQRIAQWDLCAGSGTAIVASQYTVAATSLGTGMQLAPNGKIYVAKFTQSNLGVINNPNAAGAACAYSNTAQPLGAGICYYSLPAFVNRPLSATPFTFTTQCQMVQFTNSPATSTAIAGCAYTPSLISYSWNFGDPASAASNTSTVLNPSHNFSGLGTYTTFLVLNYPCYQDTLKKIITISSSSPTFAVTGPTAICKGESAILKASSASAYTYSWSSGSSASSISINPQNTVSYTVTSTNSLTGCSWPSVVTLVVNKCTGIADAISLSENIRLYPNPASHQLTIQCDLSQLNSESIKNMELSIMNSVGQIVLFKNPASSKEQVDVSSWPKGIYLVKLKSGELFATKKIVVE